MAFTTRKLVTLPGAGNAEREREKRNTRAYVLLSRRMARIGYVFVRRNNPYSALVSQ